MQFILNFLVYCDRPDPRPSLQDGSEVVITSKQFYVPNSKSRGVHSSQTSLLVHHFKIFQKSHSQRLKNNRLISQFTYLLTYSYGQGLPQVTRDSLKYGLVVRQNQKYSTESLLSKVFGLFTSFNLPNITAGFLANLRTRKLRLMGSLCKDSEIPVLVQLKIEKDLSLRIWWFFGGT